jgi:hypothetical protein
LAQYLKNRTAWLSANGKCQCQQDKPIALHQVTCSASAALRVHEWAVSRVNMSQVLEGPSPDASLLYGLIQPNGGWGLYQLRIINRIYYYLPSFIRCEAPNVSLPKDGIWELHAR